MVTAINGHELRRAKKIQTEKKKKQQQVSREELAAEHDEVTMIGWWARLSKNVMRNHAGNFPYSHVLHVCKYKYPAASCHLCWDRFFRRMKDM